MYKLTFSKSFFLCIYLLLHSYLVATPTSEINKNLLPDYPLRKGLIVTINSTINPATLNYLATAFSKAHQENWDFLLVKMNTPGGLVSTTKEILTLFGESKKPVIVWVTPEGASATSAGAIISSGAHFLFMTPGTNIGAATPVTLTDDGVGDKEEGPTKEGDAKEKKAPQPSSSNQKNLHQKAVNDLVSLVKSLGKLRGRNEKPFAEMIETAASFEAQEAHKKGMIDGLAHTPEELFKQLHQRQLLLLGVPYTLQVPITPVLQNVDMDLGQKILDIFANPSLAYILFLLGAALIYLEFQAAGTYVAGSIGVVCLLLAGIAFQVLPLNFGALGLILFSFILFFLETYVTSYGLLTLAGLSSLIFGSLFLFRSDNSYLHFSPLLVVSVALAITFFISLMSLYWYIDARKQKKRLKRTGDDPFEVQGKSAQIIALLPGPIDGLYQYQVKIGGEIWKGTSINHFKIGDIVHIQRIDTKKLSVEI